MEGWSDDRLVREAQHGDLEAFAELCRGLQKKIYSIIFAMTRNHQDADDLAQETFMQAFKSLKNFRRRSSFYTWIYRIAVNLTLNFLRKRPKERGQNGLEESLPGKWSSSEPPESPEVRSMSKELSEKLQSAIDSLPLSYRASFTLVVLQGLTHGQAARVLGCSENTVSWRMHKARKMLQARLEPYLREE